MREVLPPVGAEQALFDVHQRIVDRYGHGWPDPGEGQGPEQEVPEIRQAGQMCRVAHRGPALM